MMINKDENMKKLILSLTTLGFALISPVTKAVEDPLMLRVRWLVVSPTDHSNEISIVNGVASVKANITPEIDISYFFTENLAAELITAYSRHQVRANGTALGNLNLGEVSLLPPTLTLQWHFLPHCIVDPYIGGGMNYTYFYGVDTGPIAQHIDYNNSFGGVIQAGLNINFCRNWHINLDVKKVWIDTDVTVRTNGPAVTELKTSVDIDPWIVGLGIGFRFC